LSNPIRVWSGILGLVSGYDVEHCKDGTVIGWPAAVIGDLGRVLGLPDHLDQFPSSSKSETRSIRLSSRSVWGGAGATTIIKDRTTLSLITFADFCFGASMQI